jgi:sterol desaturase/sphingolipid hydroxylase (fatty acid hydroxylase superfamily)
MKPTRGRTSPAYKWRKSHKVNTTGGLLFPAAVAVICVVPAAKPVATPLLLIVATFGALLAQ